MTPAELAGGFGLPDVMPMASRIEQGFIRRLRPLPARPDGFCWSRGGRAARRRGAVVARGRAARDRSRAAAGPAEDAGLIEFGARVRFRHPLVRSAACRAAGAARTCRSARRAGRGHRPGRSIPTGEPGTAPRPRRARRGRRRRSSSGRPAGRRRRGGAAAAAAFLERAAAADARPGAPRRPGRWPPRRRSPSWRARGGARRSLATAELCPLDEAAARPAAAWCARRSRSLAGAAATRRR